MTKDYIARYKKIDYLKDNISKFPFYYIINVPGEIMSINKDEIPDQQARVLARKRFVHNLSIVVVRGSLSVDVYKYASLGSLSE